jgi:hypothetical protein
LQLVTVGSLSNCCSFRIERVGWQPWQVITTNEMPWRVLLTHSHSLSQPQERGVVWEESIILAPRATRFAFLSATIPNAKVWGGGTYLSVFEYRNLSGHYNLFGDDAVWYCLRIDSGGISDTNWRKIILGPDS